MRILIAPDSFKESLPAAEVAAALAAGVARALPAARCEVLPLADGGEGTVAAVLAATGGREVSARVTGPLGAPVDASFGLVRDGRAAVVELAAASGLALVPAVARDPLVTTTYGTGELLRAALDAGVDTLLVGLGGSATVDGGAGLLQALGARFIGEDGAAIAPPLCGGLLAGVARIELDALDPRLAAVRIEVACDVDNPLLGPRGAAAVFGPQKGADPAAVARLDAGLGHYCDLLEAALGQRVREVPGAGAAGGAGAAFVAALGARLRPGIEIVLEALDFERRLDGVDLVITGEGRLDVQTLYGKAPQGVARAARARGIPVVAVGGSIAADAEEALLAGFDAIEACVTRPMSLDEALASAAAALQRAGYRIGCWLRLARGA